MAVVRTLPRQIAFGTATEPSKWGQGAKHWAVERDITHLQALLRPGATVLFIFDNQLSNIYNVPLWAEATLRLLYAPYSGNRDRSGDEPASEEEALSSPSQVLPLLEARAAGSERVWMGSIDPVKGLASISGNGEG